MTRRLFLESPEAVADAVRAARHAHHWTQADLASKARVERRFVAALESGHQPAELSETLSVLDALDIHAVALPEPPPATPLEEVDLTEVIERFSGPGPFGPPLDAVALEDPDE